MAVILAGWPHAALQAASGPQDAVPLPPDGPPQALRRYWPAGGPLDRFEGHAGSWYALLYVPVVPGWPVQLALWPTDRRHQVHLLALDAAPAEGPGVAAELPVEFIRLPGSRRSQPVARFVLPPQSQATGIYVLVDQWRADGARPPTLWVQLQPQVPGEQREDALPAGQRAAPVMPPDSPLTRHLAESTMGTELPILGRLPLPVREGEP